MSLRIMYGTGASQPTTNANGKNDFQPRCLRIRVVAAVSPTLSPTDVNSSTMSTNVTSTSGTNHVRK